MLHARRTPFQTIRPRLGHLLSVCAVAAVAAATLIPTAAGTATTASGRTVAGSPVAGRTAVAGCGPQVYKTDGSPWTCSFADNFSGTSVDPDKWLVASTAATGFSVGRTCFEPWNVTEGGGSLDLTAADIHRTFWCRAGGSGFFTRYTGGHLATNGRFAQTYGRFEVRARYPRSGSGLHAGFWMYPAKMTYGAWPASGEIDVSEWWSVAPNTMVPTLHYRGSSAAADSSRACTVTDPTAWHVYRVVWQPTVISFSIDGRTCFSRQWTPTLPQIAPEPFNRPFTLVLTNAVDANSGFNRVTSSTALPATYQVDYARAWR